MFPAIRGTQPLATVNKNIRIRPPRVTHGRKEEILTDSMENPHFIRIRLRDVQDHLVLSKDSTGTLSLQQHDRHVLKVYRGWGGKMERADGGLQVRNTPVRPFVSPHTADDTLPAVVRMST